jgi:hypothetical protein
MRPGVEIICPPFAIHCASIWGLRKCRTVKANTIIRIPTTDAITVASMSVCLIILRCQLDLVQFDEVFELSNSQDYHKVHTVDYT